MILIETTKTVINTEEITRGTLIWAKHRTWDEGRTGIVTEATEKTIIVLFLPTLQNVQNHFAIQASELGANAWQIRYSSDGLENMIAFGFENEEEREG